MGLMDSRKEKERDLANLHEQARQKQAQGLGQFVLQFSTGYGNSFDRRNRLEGAMQVLEELGIEVTNVQNQEWDYSWTISCRNVAVPPAPSVMPTASTYSGPTGTLQFNSTEELSPYLQQQLAPWSGPARMGQTFGPGYGLEGAVASIATVDGKSLAFCNLSKQLALTLGEAIVADQLTFDDMDRAFGFLDDDLRRARVPNRAAALALFEAGSEPKSFISYSLGMERWNSEAVDYMSEMTPDKRKRCFVWNHVAYTRLGGNV